MQYKAKQIIDKQIVTNIIDDCIQQQGIDVRVRKISKVTNMIGFIPKNGKTKIPQSYEITPYNNVYRLEPGYYEVEFEEGCNIPNNVVMYLKTRSSLIRCGAEIKSGQFDGGFRTDNIGAFLKVSQTIMIEKGARLAQCIVSESYELNDNELYNGQWQNDKQR